MGPLRAHLLAAVAAAAAVCRQHVGRPVVARLAQRDRGRLVAGTDGLAGGDGGDPLVVGLVQVGAGLQPREARQLVAGARIQVGVADAGRHAVAVDPRALAVDVERKQARAPHHGQVRQLGAPQRHAAQLDQPGAAVALLQPVVRTADVGGTLDRQRGIGRIAVLQGQVPGGGRLAAAAAHIAGGVALRLQAMVANGLRHRQLQAVLVVAGALGIGLDIAVPAHHGVALGPHVVLGEAEATARIRIAQRQVGGDLAVVALDVGLERKRTVLQHLQARIARHDDSLAAVLFADAHVDAFAAVGRQRHPQQAAQLGKPRFPQVGIDGQVDGGAAALLAPLQLGRLFAPQVVGQHPAHAQLRQRPVVAGRFRLGHRRRRFRCRRRRRARQGQQRQHQGWRAAPC